MTELRSELKCRCSFINTVAYSGVVGDDVYKVMYKYSRMPTGAQLTSMEQSLFNALFMSHDGENMLGNYECSRDALYILLELTGCPDFCRNEHNAAQ